jgi:hypothetical protein
VHRTVWCTTGHLLCSVRCTPSQPTVGACSSRSLDPTVAICPVHTGQSGVHRTVRCYSQRAPVCGLSAQTVRCHTGQSGAHRTLYVSKWACRASPTRHWRAQARHDNVTGWAGLARGPKSLPRHGTPNINRAGPGRGHGQPVGAVSGSGPVIPLG